jgi:outer membrane protein OmpA-like peptidoglycan-associated protein
MLKSLVSCIVVASLTGCANMDGTGKSDNDIITDEVVLIEDAVVYAESLKPSDGMLGYEDDIEFENIGEITLSEKNYMENLDVLYSESGSDVKVSKLPKTQTSELQENPIVWFGHDKYEIQDSSKATIDIHLGFLLDNPKVRVILEGHTDEIGTSSYNLILGEKRSRSVANYLESMGVNRSQLEVISYGELNPDYTGNDRVLLGKNRRVVFTYN